jgi:uncharacterized repeat protein (TIGR03987 family)
MPINIMIGILSVIVALVLYTIGVWGAFRAHTVNRKHLIYLWVGFVFDVLTTAMMALQVGGIQNDLHSILALIAMFGMLAGAAIGTWAYIAGRDAVSAAVARWLLAPWILWVFVFVWGMMTRGAARMGN